MPLTNAEKQKKYRDRMRENNPEKFEEIKKRNAQRERKRVKKYQCSAIVQTIQKKRWRENQKDHRSKSKNNNKENESTNDNLDENSTTDHSAEKRSLQRHWAYEKSSYTNTIKKMSTEIHNLKKKCKRYMQKNKSLIKLVDDLKSTTVKPKVIQKQVENEEKDIKYAKKMTPLSKTNSYIQENLPNINEEEKEKVKKKILIHNILVHAIQDTYSTTKKTEDRNILKKVVENQMVGKYKMKTELAKSVLGLKGRSRWRKIHVRRNMILNEIHAFYNRDDVSQATAGKKEFKVKGKIKRQRRYLLNTLKELFKKYKAEGGKAKLSSFKKYRPFHVLPPKLTNRETCGCVKHENFMMKLTKLHSLGMIDTKIIDEILSNVMCNLNSKECAYGECSVCKNSCINFEWNSNNLNDVVIWSEFALEKHEYKSKSETKPVVTKRMVKKEKSEKLKFLIEMFHEDVKVMKKHVYNIKHQYKQYRSCIKNLTFTEVAIHIDFSENYVCKLATEVQSMHFGASKAQITIHTGVLYMNEKQPQAFATLSPSTEHGPEAIWAHLEPILTYVKKENPLVTAVHFFSDGPATQYKQKKNFFLFTKHTKQFGFSHSTWNFSEASHGKGAADGVGGGLKRRLDNYVSHGTDVPDAYSAYTELKKSDTSVIIFYIQEAEIAKYVVEENLIPVPKTMSLHQITNTETMNVIRFRCLSCFCGDFSKGYCECLNVRNHLLVKNVKNHNDKDNKRTSNLKRKCTDVATCINTLTEDDKPAKKAKVTILSEVKFRNENMKFYSSLKKYGQIKLQDMQRIGTDFNLLNTNNNENIDNSPIPSTSGTSYPQNKRPVIINSEDSSTDNDDQYSVHDSSEGEFYEGQSLSDVDEGSLTEVQEKSTIAGIMDLTEAGTENNCVKLLKMDYTGPTKLEDKTTEIEAVINKIGDDDNPDKTKEEFNVDNSVIVRYFNKKSWKYYVGFIESKVVNAEETFYSVRFLKTIKNPVLKFVTTKRVDRDVVPAICILKKIELVFDSKAYTFQSNDKCANEIYF